MYTCSDCKHMAIVDKTVPAQLMIFIDHHCTINDIHRFLMVFIDQLVCFDHYLIGVHCIQTF